MSKLKPGRSARATKRPALKLDCDALELARVYAAHTPLLALDQRIHRLLRHLSEGRVSLGYSLLADASTEFGGDLEHVRVFSQFSALISKVPFRVSDIDRREAAFNKWLDAERSCRVANKRLGHYFSHPSRFESKYPDVSRVFNYAREYIRRVLGDLTINKYEAILSLSRPGGGVSIGTRSRERVAPVFKYADSDTCMTPGTVPIYRDWLRQNPGFARVLPLSRVSKHVLTPSHTLTHSNRLSFVPKNGKTFRSIAVEPNASLWFQLGVHEYLRLRFKTKGVAHIDDQRHNQLLAELGSRHWTLNSTLSTIDLSSASDTVCTTLVEWLLPESWYLMLDSLRAKSTTVRHNGEKYEVQLAKFSSMGNGFTFGLETLVFKALSEGARHYAGGSITSVYGDDIIIDARCALLLLEVLKFAGFAANSDKTFIHGKFRESCGTDWYDGHLATPQYVRSERIDVPSAYRLVNSLSTTPGDRAVRELLLKKLSDAHALRFGLENEDSSSCIFTTFAYAKGIGALKWDGKIQNWKFRSIQKVGVTFRDDTFSFLSALLGGTGDLPIKGRTRYVWRWTTAGPERGRQGYKV